MVDDSAPRKAYRRLDDGAILLSEADEDQIKFLLMDREQFRLDKDFKEADKLRDQIEDLGVEINDKDRTWKAVPKKLDKKVDLNSAAVTAALTLHPVVWVSDFDEHATEKSLSDLFQVDFPDARFRMAREQLEPDDDDEDGLGLESIVSREGMSRADPEEPEKKVGNSLGYGTVNFPSADIAKDFIYRFDEFPFGKSEGGLKCRVSKESLRGSLRHRNKKLTEMDRRLKSLRGAEKARADGERDAFKLAQAAARAPAAAPPESPAAARPKAKWGALKFPQAPAYDGPNATGNATAFAAPKPGSTARMEQKVRREDDTTESESEGEGGVGGGLGGLLGGYGDDSDSGSDSSDDDDDDGGGTAAEPASLGGAAKRAAKPRETKQLETKQFTVPESYDPGMGSEPAAKKQAAGGELRAVPIAFVSSAGNKQVLAKEAMQAKLTGDTDKYNQIMVRMKEMK